jgi:hypothetical protein
MKKHHKLAARKRVTAATHQALQPPIKLAGRDSLLEDLAEQLEKFEKEFNSYLSITSEQEPSPVSYITEEFI